MSGLRAVVAEWDEEWRRRAACRGLGAELFFPVGCKGDAEAEIAKAKEVCAGCSTQEECLEFALGGDPVEGVWGGTDELDRRLLRRRRLDRRATRQGVAS